MKQIERFIPLVFTLLSSITCFVFFDLVFDDSYDSFNNNLSYMLLSPFSFFDFHYLGYIGLKDIYKFLQDLFPSISVFATCQVFLACLSLYYTLYSVNSYLKDKTSVNIRVLFSLLISICFLENIISISHTRYASIFAGVALINIFWNKTDKKSYLYHFAFYMLGFLTRPESGLGMLFIVGVAYLIYSLNLKSLIKKSILPALAIIIFNTTFYIHHKYTDRFEIKIEPDIEYAFSTNRVIPLGNMENALDSFRYEMAINAMFIDTSFVNVAFLKSLVSNQYEINQIGIINSISTIIGLHKYYLLFISFISFSLLILCIKKEWKLCLKVLLFQLFLFTLLVYLDYNVRVEERHFYSIQILSLIITSYHVFNTQLIYRKKFLPFYLLFGFALLFSIKHSLKNALGNQIQVAEDVECLESIIENFEGVYQNRTVITSISSFHLFDRKYSFTNDRYTKNRYIMYDLTNHTTIPRYMAYLSEICACDAQKPKEFLKWANMEKAIFISTDKRFELMEKYMDLTQSTEMKFSHTAEKQRLKMPECMQHSVHNNYEIKQISRFKKTNL